MKITDILSKNNIFLNIDVTSKKLLFKEISQQISKKAKVGQNEILEKLNEREKLGTTAIGNGVAIPHMKIENLKQIFSIFFKLVKPIDFSSNDNKGVDLVFVLVAPEKSQTEHLLALSTIAKFMRNDKNKIQIRQLKNIERIYTYLEQN